jgi:hypothetical protein
VKGETLSADYESAALPTELRRRGQEREADERIVTGVLHVAIRPIHKKQNGSKMEALGFIFVALLTWVNEYLDLPHMFLGARQHPGAPVEVAIESGFVLPLGTAVTGVSWLTFRRLAYLESLLGVLREAIHRIQHLSRMMTMCAWCRRVAIDGDWISITYRSLPAARQRIRLARHRSARSDPRVRPVPLESGRTLRAAASARRSHPALSRTTLRSLEFLDG